MTNKSLLITIAISIIAMNSLAQVTDNLIDLRDGKKYIAVKIGNQIWMAENLNYNTNNSWCYDDSSSNCNKYGRLYTWEAAKTACPAGWHLPSDDEWTTLTNYLGRIDVAGGKLKSTNGWNSPDSGVTNNSGFTALPGGYRGFSGTFDGVGTNGLWWSSTEDGRDDAWYRVLDYSFSYVGRFDNDKDYGFSVRCLRDK